MGKGGELSPENGTLIKQHIHMSLPTPRIHLYTYPCQHLPIPPVRKTPTATMTFSFKLASNISS